MVDKKNLEEKLNKISDDSIILLETNAEDSFETSMASIKLLSDKHDNGIVLSASRPYVNLVNNYKKNDIDTNKMFILDCISKKYDGDKKSDNVMFLENVSALTDISLSLSDCMQTIDGKKFIIIDSINTMLIHNKPHIFSRFIHGILTKMRLNGVGGLLILGDKTNKEVKAEITQLCDKVIKVK